jgi:transposase
MRTIGIDLGKINSQLSERNERGDEIRNVRFETTRAAFHVMFGDQPKARVLLEASTITYWVAKLLRNLGHEVVVADPNFLPMYVDQKSKRKKSDKGDARLLSLALFNGNWRLAHERSEAEQVRKCVVDARAREVGARTRIVNGVRATFARLGVPLPACEPERLREHVKLLLAELPKGFQLIIKNEMRALRGLNECIASFDRQLARAAKSDPKIKRLATVPGVGPVVAAAFVATIDDPQRFADGHELASFLGLAPSESSSGEKRVLGAITKAGPKALRSLLVQSGWSIWRSKDPDAARIKAWAQRIALRRGSKRLAAVAIARKLGGVLLAMWKNERDFDPNWKRQVEKMKAAA